MSRYTLAFVLLLTLAACRDKENPDEAKSPLEMLFAKYDDLKLPFFIVDSTLSLLPKKDTLTYNLFSQLVPDTVFNNPFGKNRKLSIYPVGKIEQELKESYLATLVKSKDKAAVYLSVFDKGRFTTNLALLISDSDKIVSAASIDKKLSVSINKEWTVNNDFYYSRIIYAYNNVGVFTTVLTETNEERSTARGATNPLDTFPKKNKYSGDYATGSKNFLYIRDGSVPDEYLFYVFFENENDDQSCTGELKGKFKMLSDKEGIYSDNGDPCVLNFSFASNEVKVKETGTCGNYRGIKCFFSHTFIKRKEQKNPVKKK